MAKTSILIALLLQLCTMIQGLVPCSEHYSLIIDPETNEIIGQIEILSPLLKHSPYNLKVGFNTNPAIHWRQPVARIEMPQQSVQDIEEGKSLLFPIHFTAGVAIPRLTKISFNNQQICPNSGETEDTTTVEIERIISIEQLPSSTTAMFNNSVIDDECGISNYSASPNLLIVGGDTTIPGQWPWLVALFIRKGFVFQCAGSLLTKKHILTAGHCLKFNATSKENIHPNTLKVALGRFNLHQFDAEGTVNREVASYTIHPDYAHKTTGDSDLAILILKTPVEYSHSIKPICLWSGSTSLQNVISRTGYVVGWGKDEFGHRYTEEPRMARMPIVSHENCHWSDSSYVTFTSNRTFCAGTRDGGVPCNGDSGSGLMLFDANTNRFQLRGVVSRSVLDNELNCDQTKFVVFVDVAKYLPWIHQQISTTINNNVEPQQSTKILNGYNIHNECGVSGYADRTNLLINNGEETLPGQWPWVVAIFVLRKDYEFTCGGSILSNKHVLTAAHCLKLRSESNDTLHPNVLVVALGRFNLTQWREGGTENREVASFKIHPDYTHTLSGDSDLAILTLKTPIEFNVFIKPICLWSGPTELTRVVNRTGYIVGWGQDELGNRNTENPRMARVPIVDQERCLRSYWIFGELTSTRTFCAGTNSESGPCNGDSGSGLVIYDSDKGRYQLRGVVSRSLAGDDFLCDLKKYIVYVDVAKYIPWIQEQIST